MYVITGGAGFLGSNLAAGIEERGLGEITVVDRFQTDDRWRNIAKRSLRDVIFPEKIFDYLDAHAGRIDAVLHINYTGFSDENNVDALIDDRIHLTWRLWSWCSHHQVPFRGVLIIKCRSFTIRRPVFTVTVLWDLKMMILRKNC